MTYLWLVLAQITQDEIRVPRGDLTADTFQKALQIVFGVIGGVAVLIVTVAGFQYVLSQGDPQATAKAKNTIIDAMIGLAVSLLAFGIVSFVFSRI